MTLKTSLLAFILAPALLAAADPAVSWNALQFQPQNSFQPAAVSIERELLFPGNHSFLVTAPTSSWAEVSTLSFDIQWPAGSPTNAQVMIHLRDWDFYWYQNLLPTRLIPGRSNHFTVNVSPTATGWEPKNHHGTWYLGALQQPKEVAIHIFADEGSGKATCRIEHISATLRKDSSAPWIRNVRPSSDRVPRNSKFEITFDLPDRYTDPFDPEQVNAFAEFTTPNGATLRADAFYTRRFYRQPDATKEAIYPQGAPCWQVRFTPVTNGTYRYTLHVADRLGEASWGPGFFTSDPSTQPGFVRVSRMDPRFFELDSGSSFFPLGHNIRSPFDTRMDTNFKWTQRWPEGAEVYTRYFQRMHDNGENTVEIWSSAWSLGLEWTPRWRGYHGLGQYNMIHAWEMDAVLTEAERQEIRINYVVHNHGKFGMLDDSEWEFNPLNVRNGGFLTKPEEYFTDPRAMKSFRNLMRYTIARWGYSPNILAWELWSELDLTGSQHGQHMRQETVDWHRLMTRAIKDLDPYDHLISTHVCSDYTHQNRAIVALPELDHSACDAYHSSPNPTYIVTLMNKTAEFNGPFAKPVLITEFGGSPHAQGVKHLEETLHAALWASTATPIAGAPMFWWWQLIDEENFYTIFASVSRFMNGEDRRGIDMMPALPDLLMGDEAAPGLAIQCLKNKDRAYGWIYHANDFGQIDPTGPAITTGVTVRMDNMAAGRFRVEYWDTLAGKKLSELIIPSRDGQLTFGLPAFARDIAFKVKPQK